MYYVFITLSTIGYGDYVPGLVSENGWLQLMFYVYVICWIFSGLVFFSITLDRLSNQTKKIGKGSRRFVKSVKDDKIGEENKISPSEITQNEIEEGVEKQNSKVKFSDIEEVRDCDYHNDTIYEDSVFEQVGVI